MSAGEARGRCHCGRVRFVARFPSRFNAHCHCESCRRAHGAAFVTWVGFPSAQVTVTEGGDLLRAHESSPGTRRSFGASGLTDGRTRHAGDPNEHEARHLS